MDNLGENLDMEDKQEVFLEEFGSVNDVDDSDLVEYVFQFEKSMEDGVCIDLIDSPAQSASNDDGPSMEKVKEFCKEQEKINTKRATERDVKNLSQWLATEKFELRALEQIPPKLLNEYMAQYFVFIRKPDGLEYQPGTLLNMFHSIERYLKSCKYFSSECRVSILKHDDFEDCRMALHAKRRDLKKKGLGNRPHRSVALEEAEEDLMWEKGVFGVSSPFSLQFSIWFYLTLLMGLRGRDEHRAMRFGDIQIKTDSVGKEYLVLTERTSKTRDGSVANDCRETAQKVFCSCSSSSSDRCVVEIWKAFVSRRPADFCSPEDPLYLQSKSDDQIKSSHTEIWFKHLPLGANSLGKLLPKACSLAGLEPRGNHGVRATTVQRLRKAEIPDDHIIQITGHKSVRTLAVYDTNQLSNDVHKKCQAVLQKPHALGSAGELEVSNPEVTEIASSTSTSLVASKNVVSNVSIEPRSLGVQSMFSGAVFNQCVFNLGSTRTDDVNIEQ